MLHLREPLQSHQLRHGHAAEFAHSAEVVAEEVGDHHQLRAFFFAGLQLVGELGVALRIGIARAGALDGAGLDVLAAEAQKTLGAGGGNLEIARIKKSRKRRGTGGVQRAMKIPAIGGPSGGEALGEVDLVNIPGANVGEDAAGGGDELLAGEV